MPGTLRLHVCTPGGKLAEQHAWLSLEVGETTTTYGMQFAGSPFIPEEKRDPETSDGKLTNLYRDSDQHWAKGSKVVREMQVDDEQIAELEDWADKPHRFNPEDNNCAHAARDGWEAVTGEYFDVNYTPPEFADEHDPPVYACPAGLAASVAKGPSVRPPEQEQESQLDADFGKPPLPPRTPEPEPEEIEEEEEEKK